MANSKSLSMTWQIFKNTYLMFGKQTFRKVICDEDFNRVLGLRPSRHRSLLTRLLSRGLWFWPRIEDARGWVVATSDSNWNPESYLHTHRTKLIDKMIEVTSPTDSLLELGCNCGSDMAQLYAEGYRKLMGVDASSAGLQLFESEYPETFSAAEIRHDLFQRYVMSFSDNEVDYVYSNGATIELVHPSFPIVAEICRITRSGVLLDLSIFQQGYSRDYVKQFAKCGFDLVYSDESERPDEKSHIFVFLSSADDFS